MRNVYLLLGAVSAAILSANCGRSEGTTPEEMGTTEARLSIPTRGDGVEFQASGKSLVARFRSTTRELHARVALPTSARGDFSIKHAFNDRFGVAVQAVGSADVPAVVEDGLVHYKNAFGEGTDAFHNVTQEGTEDFVRFESAPATPKLSYRITIEKDVAGLRLVNDNLEFLDKDGTPHIRVNAPYGIDARGQQFPARLAVRDCAVDTDPRAPWGREVTRVHRDTCTVEVSWASDVAYPATIDPAWVSSQQMAQNNVSYEMLMAKLSGGKVLVANASSSTQLFDPVTNTWAVTGNAATAATHRSRLVATDGDTAIMTCPSPDGVDTYNLATGLWTPGTVIGGGFDDNGVAIANLGGNNVLMVQSNGTTSVYDRVAKTYTGKTATSNLGYNPALIPYTANKFIFQGASSSTVRVYDAVANTWASPTAALAGDANCNSLAVLSDGKVLSYSQNGLASVLDLTLNTSTAVTGVPAALNSTYFCARTAQIAQPTATLHWIAGGRLTFDEGTAKITDNGVFTSTAAYHGAIVRLNDGRYLAAGGNNTYPNKLTDIYSPIDSTECSGNPFGALSSPVYNSTTKNCSACDGDNGGATALKCPTVGAPACQTAGGLAGQCTQCSATNTTLCTGATPSCNTTTGACAACDGDNAGATALKCATAGAPICNLAGGLAGKCTQCSATSAALCTGNTPSCESTTGSCAACNGGFGSGATAACLTGASPVCKGDGTCVAANGDNGTGATAPCPTTDNPYSKGDGTCGKCTANADCTTGASHAGTICNVATGACGNVCASDADCVSTSFCDMAAMPKSCTPKKAGGATCATAVECSSGSCTATKCDTACTTTANCTAGNYCDTAAMPKICKTQKANGSACTAADQCTGGACTANVCATASTPDSGVSTDGGSTTDGGTSTTDDGGTTTADDSGTSTGDDSGTSTGADSGAKKDSGAGTTPAGESTEEDSSCSCTTGPKPAGNGLLALAFAGVLGLAVRRSRRAD